MPANSLPETLLHAARIFWYAMRPWWWKAFWHLRAEGLEHLPAGGPMILCANHTSHLDAPAILASLPRQLALKTSTAAANDVWAQYPVRHLLGRLTTNCLAIERKADFAVGLRKLQAVLDDQRPLLLFPEGRRSTTGRILPFKPGAAMLSIRANCPIVPIHIHGAFASLPRESILPSPTDIRLRFGRPIMPGRYVEAIATRQLARREAYEELSEALRQAILSLVMA
jgi:1-acyl-sn-glycerol-3-phosphate acyltransferase